MLENEPPTSSLRGQNSTTRRTWQLRLKGVVLSTAFPIICNLVAVGSERAPFEKSGLNREIRNVIKCF